MTSHRRPSRLARVFGSRRAASTTVPAQRRPSIELVDASTRVAHRVTSEQLVLGCRTDGSCTALCGVRVLAASLTDPGRRHCSACQS
jgi:hypothetical protein